jgi:hypothetical protein
MENANNFACQRSVIIIDAVLWGVININNVRHFPVRKYQSCDTKQVSVSSGKDNLYQLAFQRRK